MDFKDDKGEEMQRSMAWLSAFVGDSKQERWDALAPLAALAHKRNDHATLLALISAGANPWPAMFAALATDDERSWSMLLPAAFGSPAGIDLHALRDAFAICADERSINCFHATANLLATANAALAASQASTAGLHPHSASPQDTVVKNLWEKLAQLHGDDARAAAAAAVSAGYSYSATWQDQGVLGSPLFTAISANNFDLSDELMSMGAPVARGALLAAIWRGGDKLLSLVIARAGPAPENDGWDDCPLEAAIIARDANAIRILLSAGADPNAISANAGQRRAGLSMLQVMQSFPAQGPAHHSSREAICSALLAAGADPTQSLNGSSPLDVARAAADVGNGIDRAIFSMMEAAVAHRQLVADLEASALPAPPSQAPKPRL